MPEELKRHIMSGYLKKGKSRKAAERIAYATMTKMGWRRGMSEKEAKRAVKGHMVHRARKKALGLAVFLVALLAGLAWAVTPPTTISAKRNKPNLFGGWPQYGLNPYTQEALSVPTSTDTLTFIPWTDSGSTIVGYQAVCCRVVATQGIVWIRPFGPTQRLSPAVSKDVCISASADSVSAEWYAPTVIDSLHLTCASGTGRVIVTCF